MSMPERRGTQALEAWARRATSGYEGVTINNMSTAWRNGLAFCALIHRFRPDLIEFSSLKPENILENNSLAFRVAEQQLGIPALLDAEDMVQHPVPDRLSVLTYVSQFYRAFSAMGLLAPNKQGQQQGSTAGDGKGRSVPVTPTPAPRPHPPAATETKTDKVLGRIGRVRREVCASCHNPVFLAERLLVGAPGQLMHRTCFRCARCSTQLTLASYYQTERGQYCCETCPDEERAPSPDPSPHPTPDLTLSTPGCQTDTDSDSSSEDSEEEDEAPELPQTPIPTPSPSAPRPRTVFLSQTLVTSSDQPTDQPPGRPKSQPSHFTQVSPALFGGAGGVGRVREHSPDPLPSPRTAKALKTEPPQKPDTGQMQLDVPTDTHTPTNVSIVPTDIHISPVDTCRASTDTHKASTGTCRSHKDTHTATTSIVARRLKMFQEISNKGDHQQQRDERTQQQQNDARTPHTTLEDKRGRRSFTDSPGRDSKRPLTPQREGEEAERREGDSKKISIPSITVSPKETREKRREPDSSSSREPDSSSCIEPDSSSSSREPDSSSSSIREPDISSREADSTDRKRDRSRREPDSTSSIEPDTSREPDSSSSNREPDSSSREPVSTSTSSTHSLPHSTTTAQDTLSTVQDYNPFEEEEEESASVESQSECDRDSSLGDGLRDIDQVVSQTQSHKKDNKLVVSKSEVHSVVHESHRQGDQVVDHIQSQRQDSEQVVSEPESHRKSRESCRDEKDAVVIPTENVGSVESHREHHCQVVSQGEPHGPQQQYPDDLNPFGSDDDEEEKSSEATQPSSKDHRGGPIQETRDQTAAEPTQDSSRKLIKVNLNPFESDEEDEEDNKSSVPQKKEGKKSLNPFWSDEDEEEEEEEEETRGRKDTTSKAAKVKPPRPPPPTLPRNRSPSTLTPPTTTTTTTPRKKKVIAPPPPSSPQLSLSSSPGGSVALRKKGRRAPAPPQTSPAAPQSGHASPDTHSLDTQSSGGDKEDHDEVLSWKMQKDLKNHSNKINGTPTGPPKPSRSPQATSGSPLARRCSISKSEAGEWKRKKGPAPPRPVPQKRALKKLPMKVIQQELQDIEIKQTELERQGVLLETAIRKRTETSVPSSSQEDGPPNTPSSGPSSIEVEDMIMQLFELVNEKNELFRRQTELMYLKREKRLEEEHVELEYQIRCLMLKPPGERTEEDAAQEEELIARLVKVVEQRDEIINCLELDRLREAQEDESIATHMMQYQEKHIDGLENGSSYQETPKKKKTLKLPKKKKKKEKKGARGDADKDVDESETPTDSKKKKKKKKWLF